MKYMFSYINKFLFIFLFLSSKYGSTIPSKKHFVLNVRGNSDYFYFYYINLFIGKEKQKQSFILDTTSSVTSSPCNLCSSCGDHYNDYYIIDDNSLIINKLSEECESLPNLILSSSFEKDNEFDKDKCYFTSKIENEELFGLYSNNLISFELINTQNQNENNINEYISNDNNFSFPIGCTLKETGFFRTIFSDGIIGLNNDDKSFISQMHKKEIISFNLFSLCLDKQGGYLSLGEIDNKYHICPEIHFLEYIPNKDLYELETERIIIKDIEIQTKCNSIINSASTISYFPENIFNSISMAFFSICSEYGGQCGILRRIEGYGICSDFKNFHNYTNAIKYIFPNIKINFKNYEFIWEPKNYILNFYFKNKTRVCFGIDTEKNLREIILGTNFMHGYDIIFDRINSKIGFCEACCNRNLTEKNEIISNKAKINEERNSIMSEIQNNIRGYKDIYLNGDIDDVYNDQDKVVDEILNDKRKNLDKKYFKYLISFLIAIFILFAVFIFVTHFYYNSILSNRQEYLLKTNSNSNLKEMKNINKDKSSTQQIEMMETRDNTY